LQDAPFDMKFVVVGSGRCGTSFVRDALNAHPDCYVCSESYWHVALLEKYGMAPAPVESLLADLQAVRFHDGRSTLDANLRLIDTAMPDFVAGIAARHAGGMASVQDVCGDIETALLRMTGKTVFGDKTPHYGFHLAALRQLWPRLKVVHIVREGRLCALSMSRHGGYQLLAALGVDDWTAVSRFADQFQPQALVSDVDVYFAMWARQSARIAAALAALPARVSLTVRYEDMLADPVAFFERVAAFVGLRAVPDWVAASANGVVTGECKRSFLKKRTKKRLLPWRKR
jgi:hypothetical protein